MNPPPPLPANPPRYWFHAKRYGWGWGLPARREGWVVLLAYVMLMSAGLVVLLPTGQMHWVILHVLVLSALLVAICWKKGEPPKWRWGKE